MFDEPNSNAFMLAAPYVKALTSADFSWRKTTSAATKTNAQSYSKGLTSNRSTKLNSLAFKS